MEKLTNTEISLLKIIVESEIEKNIKSPGELFKNIKKIKVDYEQENFILFCLDTKNRIIKSNQANKSEKSRYCANKKTDTAKQIIINPTLILILFSFLAQNVLTK